MSSSINFLNGQTSDSLLFTNVRSSDITITDAESEYDKKKREAKENLLAEIKRRTEENTYKV